MSILLRPILALCAFLLLGLTAPAGALKPALTTADPQVCCSGADAAGNIIFFYAPKSQCPKNKVVHPDRCKPRPVCCKSPNGYYQTTSDRCRPPGAQIVPDSHCSKPVCCRLPGAAPTILTPQRCKAAGGTVVSDSYCKPKPVCCKTPNGFYSWTAAQCRQAGGTVVSANYCRQPPRKICCKYVKPDGTVGFAFLDPRKCKSVNGSQAPNRYCLRATRDLKAR